MSSELIYVHDPMCSWCFGFEPVRQKLFRAVAERMPIRRLVGGLAPDSDAPMPPSMRSMLQQTWQRIEMVIPGTNFNYDFWTQCEPRRSTYPANRAVLAARAQGEEYDSLMTSRIQQAYYREAQNPSDNETLIGLAKDLGLDTEKFAACLIAAETQQALLDEIDTAHSMGINSFPSLAVLKNENLTHIGLNYTDADAMMQQIEAV